jgi:hypothetical protein
MQAENFSFSQLWEDIANLQHHVRLCSIVLVQWLIGPDR